MTRKNDRFFYSVHITYKNLVYCILTHTSSHILYMNKVIFQSKPKTLIPYNK